MPGNEWPRCFGWVISFMAQLGGISSNKCCQVATSTPLIKDICALHFELLTGYWILHTVSRNSSCIVQVAFRGVVWREWVASNFHQNKHTGSPRKQYSLSLWLLPLGVYIVTTIPLLLLPLHTDCYHLTRFSTSILMWFPPFTVIIPPVALLISHFTLFSTPFSLHMSRSVFHILIKAATPIVWFSYTCISSGRWLASFKFWVKLHQSTW